MQKVMNQLGKSIVGLEEPRLKTTVVSGEILKILSGSFTNFKFLVFVSRKKGENCESFKF